MLLLIDKAKGMTSHDVVREVRKITGERRVGHGGTLDPNATGLLIVGVGRESTKKLGKISKNMRKTYLAEVFLGEERETDDSEGLIIVKARKVLEPSNKEVKSVLKGFVGKKEQIPPKYSAVRVGGRRAYKLARKGERVVLEPRKIEIFSIKGVLYKYPILKFETVVSSGTYIRALARDIGRRLGCGGYLKELRRTRIGKYRIEDAISLSNSKLSFLLKHCLK